MARRDDWAVALQPEHVQELEAAVAQVERSGADLRDVRREHFPLPQLGATLDGLRREILQGRGFVLLRGLPVQRLGQRRSAIAYWGIGAYLGQAVSQNGQGHLLGHIADLGRAEDDPSARIYQTSARQYYHADSCDIVGLLCLNKARSGGLSTIVSSVTVYNEMCRRAPELVDELLAPIHVDRRGEVPEGARPWYQVPVFNWHAGLLTTYYVRRYMESARRFDDVPPLTAAQTAAFDAFDAICDDPEVHLGMDFEPGDMQFLHNHQILHDRTAFQDHPQPERRRHLLRLWLCPPDGRPLPPAYAQRWGNIEIGHRGGIRVAGARTSVPLELTRPDA
jgi:hypothetical protein